MEPFRVALPSRLTPEEAVLWLRGDERPFALTGEWFGGVTVLGSEPRIVASPHRDPFALLGSQVLSARGGEAAIGGGWVGWVGYQLGARIERLPPGPPPRVVAPAFSLAFYDHVVLFDGQRWWFEGLGSPDREATLRRRLEIWERRMRASPPPLEAPPPLFRPRRQRECRSRRRRRRVPRADRRRRAAAGEHLLAAREPLCRRSD